MIRTNIISAAVLMFSLPTAHAQQTISSQVTETAIENVFRLGLMVQDTNGDRIADAICGQIIVPRSSSAAENTAAANLAARLGFETTALTLPIVLPAGAKPASCSNPMTLWVGSKSIPEPAKTDALLAELQIGEGGVFILGGGLIFTGNDAAGLLAAANGYGAHAPYQWSVSADKLQAIAHTVTERLHAQKLAGSAELIGLTYVSGQAGISSRPSSGDGCNGQDHDACRSDAAGGGNLHCVRWVFASCSFASAMLRRLHLLSRAELLHPCLRSQHRTKLRLARQGCSI